MQKIFCWHFFKNTLTCNCVFLIVSYVLKNLFLSIIYLRTTVCSISMPFFQTIATFFLWWPLGLLSMSSLIIDINVWPAFFYPKAFVYNSVAFCLITNLHITLFMVPQFTVWSFNDVCSGLKGFKSSYPDHMVSYC